jgi:hypothetical protein
MGGKSLRRSVCNGWPAMAAVAGSLLFTRAAVAQAPCEAELPTVDHVAVSEVSSAGASLQAQINPHGHETAYRFQIVWQESNPPHGEPPPADLHGQGGALAAGNSDVTVGAQFTGLQPGYIYWYEVTASSAVGESPYDPHAFSYFYTGGFPEGSGMPPYRTVAPCWANESGRLAAEQTLTEQRAKEAAKAAEEATLKRHEEERVAARIRCRVPDLRGHTLRGARRLLARGHCRVGSVRRPGNVSGALVVTKQSVRHGRTLKKGARVSVTLGTGHHRALRV